MSFVIPLLNRQEPLSRQIYLWFRQAILRRVMSNAERLPSTRELAEQLHVSRTVVVLAYEQLLAEGFVVGRGRRPHRHAHQPRQSSLVPLWARRGRRGQSEFLG